jgi:hypothetical protein
VLGEVRKRWKVDYLAGDALEALGIFKNLENLLNFLELLLVP